MYRHKINGIIINQYAFGDFDRMVMVFSKEEGRITVIAKGVRKITSQRGFHLDLLNMVSMELEGSRETRYLREIHTKESFSELKTRPHSFSAACTIALFINRILPIGAPQKTLFSLTEKTLQALETDAPPKTTLFTYFLKAMRLLGYLPSKLPRRRLRPLLWQTLDALDPQFVLQARRMLGIFPNLESIASS